jgi:hypothetical protein
MSDDKVKIILERAFIRNAIDAYIEVEESKKLSVFKGIEKSQKAITKIKETQLEADSWEDSWKPEQKNQAEIIKEHLIIK